MYVAVVIDMDYVDPFDVLGPYETREQAHKEGFDLVRFLSDETLLGHAHPHEWDYFVREVVTYNKAILRF